MLPHPSEFFTPDVSFIHFAELPLFVKKKPPKAHFGGEVALQSEQSGLFDIHKSAHLYPQLPIKELLFLIEELLHSALGSPEYAIRLCDFGIKYKHIFTIVRGEDKLLI